MAQVRDRRLGAQDAADAADASSRSISTDQLDFAGGRRAAGELALMDPHERPTGAFCTNDLVAVGLLQGLIVHGLRVPDDVAIVGYDDIDFAAAAAVPLSSVGQPRRRLGTTAAELLDRGVRRDRERGPTRPPGGPAHAGTRRPRFQRPRTLILDSSGSGRYLLIIETIHPLNEDELFPSRTTSPSDRGARCHHRSEQRVRRRSRVHPGRRRNSSAKADGVLWIKPSGTSLATMTAEDLVPLDPDAQRLARGPGP